MCACARVRTHESACTGAGRVPASAYLHIFVLMHDRMDISAGAVDYAPCDEGSQGSPDGREENRRVSCHINDRRLHEGDNRRSVDPTGNNTWHSPGADLEPASCCTLLS